MASAEFRRRHPVCWLWHAQAVHVLMRISKGRIRGATTRAAAGAGRVTIESPEARSRQMVGDHESIHRVDVLQACDLVLGIGLSNHHRESDMSERYAGLSVERLRRGNRGLAHIARVVYHHAVGGSGGAIVKSHEVHDV